jgi:hypothetical protein
VLRQRGQHHQRAIDGGERGRGGKSGGVGQHRFQYPALASARKALFLIGWEWLFVFWRRVMRIPAPSAGMPCSG